MSILDRVTITGADNSIEPEDLLQLSEEFRFVEWGILVSASNEGKPRYPTREWRDRFATLVAKLEYTREMECVPQPKQISIHVQGRWLRQLLLGYGREFVFGTGELLLACARRVQLNFHGGEIQCLHHHFCRELECPPLRDKQFIFQHDGCAGGKLMQTVAEIAGDVVDAVAFYDMSHGAGVLPEAWPDPKWMQDDVTYDYHGYAGGLGPENLAEQILLIAKAKHNGRFWIDMETKVRTGERFDIEKVRSVLEFCAPLIGKEI